MEPLAISRESSAPKSSTAIVKLFSVFLALYPLLCLYKAFSRFTIGDVILILFCFCSLMSGVKIDKKILIVAGFASYALVFLLLNGLFSTQTASSNLVALLFRLLKFIFYMFCVLTCGKKYVDFYLFKKSILIVSVAASAFMVLQYIAYYAFGKILLGRIPGLSLFLDEYSTIDYSTFYSYYFRPSSFFLEPAMFSQFMCVPLTLVLFDQTTAMKKSRIALALLFTCCMVLSTAGQGILYIVVIYLLFVFRIVRNKLKAFGILCAFIIIFWCAYQYIAPMNAAVNRLLFTDSSADARLGTYSTCFHLDILHMLFGYGYGMTPNGEWMAGAAYVWYGCGIIGLVFAICIFVSFFRSATNNFSKMICIIFFAMFFGTGLFYNYMLFWFFSLMIITPYVTNIKHNTMERNNEDTLYTRRV